MVDKDTLSYKKGFAKGIEIYTENLSKSGYDADEDNKRCVKAFKHYYQANDTAILTRYCKSTWLDKARYIRFNPSYILNMDFTVIE